MEGHLATPGAADMSSNIGPAYRPVLDQKFIKLIQTLPYSSYPVLIFKRSSFFNYTPVLGSPLLVLALSKFANFCYSLVMLIEEKVPFVSWLFDV